MRKSIFERWAKDEKEIAVHEETIGFNLNTGYKEFTFYHNFHFLELDIYKAFDEWGHSTDEFNAISFCAYVMSQETGREKLVCVPKEEWNEFKLNQELDGGKFKEL